jgi:hypothetical protein
MRGGEGVWQFCEPRQFCEPLKSGSAIFLWVIISPLYKKNPIKYKNITLRKKLFYILRT